MDKYRSKFEANIAANLTKAKLAFKYESEVLPYYSPTRTGLCRDCKSRNVGRLRVYNPDFIFPSTSARPTIYLEAKGRFTSADRTKMKNVRDEYPEADIRLLFMYNNRIRKGSKVTYVDWAHKEGFPCHVGTTLPKEWIKEIGPVRKGKAKRDNASSNP